MTTKSQRRLRVVTAVVATSIAVTGALAGCASTTSSANANKSLSIYSDQPAWKDFFVQAGTNLKKITGHGLTPVSLPSTANYAQVVQASLSTNKPGDIIKWWNGKQLEQLAATGNLTDLTAVWNADVKKGWLDDSLRAGFSYQGKVYALPLSTSKWVIYYNKAVFAKLGIDVPKTYADLTAAATKLKAAGITPMWTGQADQWTSFIPFQAFLGSVDPQTYLDLTNNKVTFSDPNVVKAMTEWQTWIKNGWMTPPDSKFADAPALLAAGKLAMLPIGTWFAGAVEAAGLKPGDGYGAFFMPPADGAKQIVYTEGGAFAVPKNSPNHDAAMTEISHWLDPSVQTDWAKSIGDNSANPTVLSTNPVFAALDTQIKDTKPILTTRYYESLPPNLVTDSTTTLDGFMVNPDTLDQVTKDLNAAAVKDWAAWKAQ